MGEPKCTFSRSIVYYRDDDMTIMIARKGYHILPIFSDRKLVGAILFIRKKDILSIEHFWANRNNNLKFMTISIGEKTEVKFYFDDDGRVEYFYQKMARVKSSYKFIAFWNRVSQFLKVCFCYTKQTPIIMVRSRGKLKT